MAITSTQTEKIALGAGVLYLNFGTANEVNLGPTRGGGEFATKTTVRDIEYDGKKGKSMGMQIVDEVDASLKVTLINSSKEMLLRALPDAALDGSVIKGGTLGIIPDNKYDANLTMFVKTADGYYKKYLLRNVMHEGGLTYAAKQKSEAEFALEFFAHWDAENDAILPYEITDVTSVVANATPVSKTALKADMDSTDALDPATYTSETWGDVAVARYLAGVVYANAHALQTEVDAAEDALEAAVAALDTLS